MPRSLSDAPKNFQPWMKRGKRKEKQDGGGKKQIKPPILNFWIRR